MLPTKPCPVIAIGLDSADPALIEKWIDAGHLRNLRKLREEGVYRRLNNTVCYAGETKPFSSTEGIWAMFQTGVRPHKSGYWETMEYNPANYDCRSDPIHGGYDYREYKPFYAYGEDFRVSVFDVPVGAVCPEIPGLQIFGWGGHYPFVIPASSPRDLLPEMHRTYGRNKILFNDHGTFWDRKYLRWLECESQESIRTRTKICLDLMHREPWDLFLAVIGETHGASHDLWFQSQPDHPLYDAGSREVAHDPLLRVFQTADEAIGKILAAAPADAHVICFSVHGMQNNVTDLTNFAFLPELLYRFEFPGKFGFAKSHPDKPTAPPVTKTKHNYWLGEIWRRKHERNPLKQLANPYLPAWLIWPKKDEGLLFPYRLDCYGAEMGWMPTQWYRPSWPKMRAFALPAYADGHVRINLEGREAKGIVSPADYHNVCEAVTQFLLRVRHGRTGKPLVREVVRTRRHASDDDPRLPHADLVVLWHPDPVDVVDSPDVGRIGPLPYHRTGGHRSEGFLIAAGRKVQTASVPRQGEVIDLGPTILRLLGAATPPHFDGRPLL